MKNHLWYYQLDICRTSQLSTYWRTVWVTLHTAFCTLHTPYCTLRPEKFTRENWTLHTKLCMLHTVNWKLHTAKCTPENCTLHTLQLTCEGSFVSNNLAPSWWAECLQLRVINWVRSCKDQVITLATTIRYQRYGLVCKGNSTFESYVEGKSWSREILCTLGSQI